MKLKADNPKTGVEPDSIGSEQIVRIVEFAGAGAALLLNVVLIYRLVTQRVEVANVVEVVIFTALLNLLLLAGLYYLAHAYGLRERKLRKLSVRADRLRRRVDNDTKMDIEISQQRAMISSLHADYCVRLRTALVTGRDEGLRSAFGEYLGGMMAMTATLFGDLTGSTCAACIKVCVEMDDEGRKVTDRVPKPDVLTLQRDDRSGPIRRATDLKYPVYRYSENAGFRMILDDDSHPDWFVCDDLKGLGRAYFSKNKQWPTYYNACVVVPIKRRECDVCDECLGLLCVDNFDGGFEGMRSVHILTGIAEDLYYAIGTTVALIQPAIARIEAS